VEAPLYIEPVFVERERESEEEKAWKDEEGKL